MPDIEKRSGVSWTSIEKIDGVSASSIESVSGVDSPPSDFLSTYPGARAAYSLRKLKEGVTVAITVTNANDATQDIGFDSNGDLNTTALASFLGAKPGRVSKWWDQTGNGNHMEQSDGNDMPYIAGSAGTIYTMSDGNTKPAVYFYYNSTSRWLDAASFNSNNRDHMVISAVVEHDTVTTGQQVLSQWGGTTSTQAFQLSMIGASSEFRLSSRTSTGGLIRTESISTSVDTTYCVVSYASVTPYEGDVDVNGDTASHYPFTNTSTGTLNSPANTMTIGRRSDNGASPLQGMVSEIVVWSDTTLPNRNSIMTDMKNYYGV